VHPRGLIAEATGMLFLRSVSLAIDNSHSYRLRSVANLCFNLQRWLLSA